MDSGLELSSQTCTVGTLLTEHSLQVFFIFFFVFLVNQHMSLNLTTATKTSPLIWLMSKNSLPQTHIWRFFFMTLLTSLSVYQKACDTGETSMASSLI